jgi:hypothetical protein
MTPALCRVYFGDGEGSRARIDALNAQLSQLKTVLFFSWISTILSAAPFPDT